MLIDFHNHYYPGEYLDAIRDGASAFQMTVDEDGNPVLHSPGDYNVLVPGHRDLDFREDVLTDVGVDMQVLSFTAPGTLIEEPGRSVELARIVNDALAREVNDRPTCFTALATLPLNDPSASADEAERILGPLGLPGVMLYSNADGVPLYDDRFGPLFDRLNEAGAVVYIHPTYPVGVEVMEEYMLMPMVGFLADTTLAAAGLVYAGVMERCPGITWVLAHLGGAVPYMAERFDRGFEAYPACREQCSVRPSEQLRQVYYDTVNFDPACLRLAIDFAGIDRIVAGSDYPHQIGSLEKMQSSLAALELGDDALAKIQGGNAARILGLADA